MEPEAPFRGQVFTVTAITLAIKQMMEGVFRGIFVEGEVGQLREAASGHLYFNLKDREALLAAVMFKWDARKIRKSVFAVDHWRISQKFARIKIQLRERICVKWRNKLNHFEGQKHQSIK